MVFPCLILQSFSSPPVSETLEARYYAMCSTGFEVVKQDRQEIPVVDSADIVVAGGGIAGVVAALQAAEEGMSVILLESRNYLGYEYTATYKCTTSPTRMGNLTGLSGRVYQELADEGIVDGQSVDPLRLKSYLHKVVSAQSLIKVCFYSYANGVLCDDNRVKGVIISDFGGSKAILSKSVVDATWDARISKAAGAKLKYNLPGLKTARRFISVHLPESIPSGSMEVSSDLGLIDKQIIIHDNIIEFSLKLSIGVDFAEGISKIQAETLRKCFSIRDYLKQEGIDIGDFKPGLETWIDEVPIVTCQKTMCRKELRELNFHTSEALVPENTHGIVLAGRSIDARLRTGSLQALLSIGELAGKTSVSIVQETGEFSIIDTSSIGDINSKDTGKLHIRELIDNSVNGEKSLVVKTAPVGLPVKGQFNVLVIGGGTSGAIAAISAARAGASVALVEVLPNLGGTGSNRVTKYYYGVPWKSKLRQEIGSQIYLSKNLSKIGLEKVSYSGEDKKYVLQELATNAGVHIYYQSLASGAVIEGGKVKGVLVDNASGRHVLFGDVIIDATGHGSIAAAAGAECVKGREKDGFLMEMDHGPLRDPTRAEDISSYYLDYPSTAIHLNIRESRRIIGDYILTFDDVIHERLFPDVICRWRSNYDSHFPNSSNQSDLAQDWTTILGLWRRPILGCIPYRSLLPEGLDNILVVGKSYSTEHDALIGGRMQPDLEHLGEAAGIAAAMASKLGIHVRNISIRQLQIELVKSGILRNQDVPQIRVDEAPSLDELHTQDFWREEREILFPPSKLVRKYSLEDFVKQLGSEEALEAMVQLYLAGKESIPLLQPLLNSDRQKVIEEAAVLLGMLGDKSAIPTLLKFLKESNTRRFEYSLTYASSRPSVPLYWSSAILLGRLGAKEAVPALTELLVQPPIPEKLGAMKRSAYGEDMFEDIGKCPPPLASFIIVALGRIGDPQAIGYIKPFLTVMNSVDIHSENKDFEIAWGIQTNTAWALAQLGNYSGVPVLIDLLNTEQVQLRVYAQKLLKTITGEQFGNDKEAWKDWKSAKE